MKRVYFCPSCKGVLNPHTKIILKAKYKTSQSLYLYSPLPGNYTTYFADDFQIKKGGKMSFSCPLCEFDFTTQENKNLATIGYRYRDTKGFVVFSKIYGQHATFLVHDDDIKSYGEDVASYENVNFFGAGSAN